MLPALLGVIMVDPHAHLLRRDLDELALDDVLDGVLERERLGRIEVFGHLRACGAHVGELLDLARVDLEVSRLGGDADDLVLVDLVRVRVRVRVRLGFEIPRIRFS